MRLLSPDVTADALVHAPLPTQDVADGSPTTAVVTLGTVAGAEVGLWEMTEGTARDTEADEIFVVLSGAGTVRFEDGSEIALRMGTAVRLNAGETTVWMITERLRKVYVSVT